MIGEADVVAPSEYEHPFTLSHLDALEAEAVHIFREVAGEFERPVILFSGGKDSIVMLHLALKAFWPAPVPFALLHVDTGHNFPEVLAYRDRTVAEHGLRLHVATPVEVCSVRDVKGLYAKQAAGEISGLTGVDDPYEAPTSPDLRIEAHTQTAADSAAALRALLTERGLA